MWRGEVYQKQSKLIHIQHGTWRNHVLFYLDRSIQNAVLALRMYARSWLCDLTRIHVHEVVVIVMVVEKVEQGGGEGEELEEEVVVGSLQRLEINKTSITRATL